MVSARASRTSARRLRSAAATSARRPAHARSERSAPSSARSYRLFISESRGLYVVNASTKASKVWRWASSDANASSGSSAHLSSLDRASSPLSSSTPAALRASLSLSRSIRSRSRNKVGLLSPATAPRGNVSKYPGPLSTPGGAFFGTRADRISPRRSSRTSSRCIAAADAAKRRASSERLCELVVGARREEPPEGARAP